MIDVTVKQTDPMNVAFLSMHAPYSQIPQAMGMVYGYAGQHGLAPVGAPRAVYFTPPEANEGNPDWELWAPVSNDVADEGPDASGLGTKKVPSQLVASHMYKGPYEAIAPVYAELGEWIGANGYNMAGPPAEIYFSDPAQVPPEEYLTEIQFPVVKR